MIMKTKVVVMGMFFVMFFASFVFADPNRRNYYDNYGNAYNQRNTPYSVYDNQQLPQRYDNQQWPQLYDYNTFGPDSSYGQRRDGTIRPEDLVPRYSSDYYRLKQRRYNYDY